MRLRFRPAVFGIRVVGTQGPGATIEQRPTLAKGEQGWINGRVGGRRDGIRRRRGLGGDRGGRRHLPPPHPHRRA